MWNLDVGFEKLRIVFMHFSLIALFSRYGSIGSFSKSSAPRRAAIMTTSMSSILQRFSKTSLNVFCPISVARSHPRDLSRTIGFIPFFQRASQRFDPRNPLPPRTIIYLTIEIMYMPLLKLVAGL